jgi:site-specific DNA-methyltransferase (adenine-specific)
MIEIKIGDCVDRLKDLADNSIDAVISDPPYGVKVLGKGWDNIGEGVQQREWHRGWLMEAYRVLKPSGVLKAFSSAVTYHHLIAMMMEAGFSDLGVEAWVYSSGMPAGNFDLAKGVECQLLFGDSNNKQFKKLKGSRREGKTGLGQLNFLHDSRPENYKQHGAFTLDPQTEQGALWAGWGTTLKKSWEPICIGVKK